LRTMTPIRIFFRDAIDNVECPACGAAKGVECKGVAEGDLALLFTHQERIDRRRETMTDADFADFGRKMLAWQHEAAGLN
jgi:hypothetical protein